MDLRTRYLGLDLAHPILPGASPLSDDPDTARRFEDAGAPALVMSSLFEEELANMALTNAVPDSKPSSLPAAYQDRHLRVEPDDYFDHIYVLKQKLGIPVIASLNGTTAGGWLRYALAIEQAGADALELNVYKVATELGETAEEIESDMVSMVDALRNRLAIPVAVKLSPFFTALPNLVTHLGEAGADAVVLFNRFYQPHIDWPSMLPSRSLRFSDGGELNLRLRWTAILAERVSPDLAISGGITDGKDVARAIACGAHAVQVVTGLYLHGPAFITQLVEQLTAAMDAAEVHSVQGLRGRLAMNQSPQREAYIRANYYRVLRQHHHDATPHMP